MQVPFWICTLIWGTTWFVIRGQLGIVPPGWSVTYRFLMGAVAMFAYALLSGQKLGLDGPQQRFAMLFGVAQFVFNRRRSELALGVMSPLPGQPVRRPARVRR